MIRLRSLLLRVHASWGHLLDMDPFEDPNIPDTNKLDAIGGQAVIEGVLMRSPGRLAVAVRAPDGSIALQSRDFVPFSKRHALLRVPVIRGAASLVEALYIGMQALNWASGIQEKAAEPEDFSKPPSSLKSKAATALTLVFSFVMALGLFQLLPYALAGFIAGGSRDHSHNPLLFNGIAGAVRITLLVTYMWALSFLPDVRRLFQYHGAEHKSIFAHEDGAGLQPDAVATQTRFHPRCGTSFILIVALICILFFSLLDAFMLHVVHFAYPNFLVRFLVHLPFVPFVAGLSFEALKLSAKHHEKGWVKALVMPGLWLQRITTREPDRDQIEVAIASAKAALG